MIFKTSQRRNFKSIRPSLFLLFFLCFYWMTVPLTAQSGSFCGTIGPFQASTSNPDSIYSDRFGNTYLIFPPSSTNSIPQRILIAGYFELTFDDDIPISYDPTIQQVFIDLSDLIERRVLTNACGDPIDPGLIKVKIESGATGSTLASATPFYENAVGKDFCSYILPSRIYEKINGIQYTFPANLADRYDGLIVLNTTSSAPWHIDWTTLPAAGTFDLYSVMLHESGHLLGFASRLENPSTTSLWDKYLHAVDIYDPSNSNPMTSEILVSDCMENCWELNDNLFQNRDEFLDVVEGSCNTTGNIDIVFGNNAIAPLSGGVLTGQIGELSNFLSHLGSSCNNNNQTYLMQRQYPSGPPIRAFTPTEINILCQIGYHIDGCDGCFALSADLPNPHRFYEYPEISCCTKPYYICENESILIPSSDLLCNDVTNGSDLVVTDMFINTAQGSFVDIVKIGEDYEITITEQGTYQINYTIEGCDCKMSNAEFHIEVGPCLDCSSQDPCQNLICTDGFEEFEARNNSWALHYELGEGYWVAGGGSTNSNSVDVCADITGNKYLLLAGLGVNKEGVFIELEEPIAPGCTVNLNFKASASATAPGSLGIFGGNAYPCPPNISVNDPSCTAHSCNAQNPNFICAGIIPITNTANGTRCVDNPALSTYNYSWINSEPTAINYIGFSPEIGNPITVIYLDDIIITKECLSTAEFTYVTNCSLVSFTSNDQNLTNTHFWDFGDGMISSEINPIHNYTSSGSFVVTHTISDDCGNSISHSEVVDIDLTLPEPDFVYTLTGCGQVDFVSNDQSVNLNHSWDFGDGSSSSTVNPMHTYTTSGTFSVIHTVSNQCGDASFTETIIIDLSPPMSNFTYVMTGGCREIAFTSSDQNPVLSHIWDFGDGNSSSAINPVHMYANNGTFSVNHSLSNDCGSTSFTETITIDIPSPDPDFMFSIEECTTVVNFFSTAMNGEEHEWDFDGDLSTVESTEENPSFDFLQFGTYTITHTVTDDCGGSSTFTQTITIEECPGNECNCPTVINAGEGTLLTDTNLPLNGLDNTGSCITINGTLIINVWGYRITGGEIQMQPGSRIIVDNLMRLELDDVDIYGCDQMWQGIDVRFFANLTMDRCMIEDAHWAINARNNSSLGVSRTIFNKNYIGIHTPVTGGGAGQFVNARLFRVAFRCTEDLIPRYAGQPATSGNRGWAGVQLNNTQSFVIGGYWGQPGVNAYNGLQHGIYLDNCSNIQIQRSGISNLVGQRTGIYIQNSTQVIADDVNISGVNTGISGQRAHPIIRNSQIDSDGDGILLLNGTGRSAFIGNNIIEADKSGIFMRDYTGNRGPVDIVQNTIQKRTTTPGYAVYIANCSSQLKIASNPTISFESGNGIWLTNTITETTIENNLNIRYTGSESQATGTGIHLGNVSGAQLYNNRVRTNGGNIVFGIAAFDSPGNLYCCNSVDNTRNGMLFSGGCAGTILRNTEFGNHADGLVLGDAVISLQDLHGNNWAGSNCTQTDAFFYSNVLSTDVLQSQFRTDQSFLPRGHNFIQVFGGGTPQEWFIFQGGDAACSYYCDETPHNPILPPEAPCTHLAFEAEINAINLWAAQALTATDELSEGIHNREQHRLLDKLDCLPQLHGENTTVDQFYQSAINAPLGAYHQMRSAINDLFMFEANDETLTTLHTESDILISQINDLSTQIGYPAIAGSENLVTNRDSLIAELDSLLQNIEVLENSYHQNRIAQSTLLIADNNSFSEAKIYEINEKAVNEVFLSTIIIGNHQLNENQKFIIDAVANQCPLSGGIAVYRARAIQALYAPQDYNDRDLCQPPSQGQPRKITSNIKDNDFAIFPNPAQTFLNVQVPSESSLPVQLEIFGLDGKLWQQEAITQSSEIDISVLPEGVYLIRITDHKKELRFQDKLVRILAE